MSQPTGYGRQFDFTNFQTNNPFDPLPGDKVDLEFNAIKLTLEEVLNNLDLIQRDDGRLENRSVGCDQLSNEALTKLGCLTNTVVNEFVFDIGGSPTSTISGADRNAKVLAYVVGAPISVHINGIKSDPATITATDGTSIVSAPDFPASAVVTVEIGEAEFVAVLDIEKFDDISSQFDGILTAFTLQVNGNNRVVDIEERATISLDDVILESQIAFTISGSTITFTTAPTAGQVWWGINRVFTVIELGGITTASLADLSVTNEKIANNTITEDKLAFQISSIPIGGGIDWYDDVLPANVPAGSLVFPDGVTIGKTGSGATLEDDLYQEAFDIFKKRWGNIGTEVFDNLDVIMIGDTRGTFYVTPDGGVGKVTANNTIGDQSGSQDIDISAPVTGGSVSTHALVLAEIPDHVHDVTAVQNSTPNASEDGVADNEAGGQVTFNTAGIPSHAGAASAHAHGFTPGTATQSGLLVLNPYTVVNKLVRLK